MPTKMPSTSAARGASTSEPRRFKALRTRLCLGYVVSYLFISGLGLLVAPASALEFMQSTADYGTIMPRWVAMMSLALAALVGQVIRHQLKVLYPLGFFMPAAMLAGFIGLYRLSADPLFLTLLAVVGVGVLLTGASLLLDWVNSRSGSDAA
jgi:hypothetical protein